MASVPDTHVIHEESMSLCSPEASTGDDDRPLVLLSCSASSRLVAIDPDTLQVSEYGALSTANGPTTAADAWSVGIVSDGDGSVYACQHEGGSVLHLSSDQLHPNGKPQVAVSCPRALAKPEGLTMYHNWLYVASMTHGSIVQLEKLPRGGLALVRSNTRGHRFCLHRFMQDSQLRAAPWGVATGPDNALYVAIDKCSEGDYSCPPLPATGCIVRVQLNPETGHMKGGSRFGPLPLHRPSGLHFTPAGDLLVTTLERKVLLLAGPQRIQPGACLRSFGAEMWDCGDRVPFDAISADGRTMVVSLHRGGLGEGEPGCLVLVCMDSGRLLRGPVASAMVQEGSAMCLYHQG